MEKINIIIPIYNSEEYLSKCLDSIINQTLKEIRTILVNDGSTDSSEEIIDKYIERKYENLSEKVKDIIRENPKLLSIDNLEMFDSEILDIGIPRIVEMAKYPYIQASILDLKNSHPKFNLFKTLFLII